MLNHIAFLNQFNSHHINSLTSGKFGTKQLKLSLHWWTIQSRQTLAVQIFVSRCPKPETSNRITTFSHDQLELQTSWLWRKTYILIFSDYSAAYIRCWNMGSYGFYDKIFLLNAASNRGGLYSGRPIFGANFF